MLSVREALEAILAAVSPAPVVRLPLADCLGLVLAEDVRTDSDSPPFDKSLMDGYAVRSADLNPGQERLRLRIIEEVLAGQVPQRPIQAGEAARIMTGAMLPRGADVVIPVEMTSSPSNSGSFVPRTSPEEATTARAEVQIDLTRPVRAGWNVLSQGASFRAGMTVLPAGRRLRGQELGAMAEIGVAHVPVRPAPTVAILATGDELVPVDQRPGPGQIRNSNETMLAAQVRQAGGQPVPLGIARDNLESLREKLAVGLRHDVLLLSGGVSAGLLDLVPTALREQGVREIFHKVRVKPGQPLWFGERDQPRRCRVFGLPGNPVSSMVCFELFARTAVRRLMGDPHPEPQPIAARLLNDFQHHGPRPTYHPARLEFTPRGPEVATVPWVGSADLCATTAANSMIAFPAGDTLHPAGILLDVLPW